MQKKDKFLLISGITFGILGFLFYFFPGVFINNFNSSEVKKLVPQVKGETTGSWSEDWKVTKWSNFCEAVSGGSLGYPYCNYSNWSSWPPDCINPSNCVSVGPSEWTISGVINGNKYTETYRVTEWIGACQKERTSYPSVKIFRVDSSNFVERSIATSVYMERIGLYYVKERLSSGGGDMLCMPAKWHIEGSFQE